MTIWSVIGQTNKFDNQLLPNAWRNWDPTMANGWNFSTLMTTSKGGIADAEICQLFSQDGSDIFPDEMKRND